MLKTLIISAILAVSANALTYTTYTSPSGSSTTYTTFGSPSDGITQTAGSDGSSMVTFY